MSIMRSAASITAGSCSTTTSVLPASRSRCMACVMRFMSRGCRPMLGSSNTNSVLTSEVPNAVVRLMRCTSPPLSVRLWRSSVRYPMPTSHKYFKRLVISSSSSLSACASPSWLFSSMAVADMRSKKLRSLSMGMIMRSCRLRPGKASSCGRVHFTPLGMKRFSLGKVASASSALPMRHSRLSVLSRAPPQSPHSV